MSWGSLKSGLIAFFDYGQDGMKIGELNKAEGPIHGGLELGSRDLDSSCGFDTTPSCYLRQVPSPLRLSGFPLRMLRQ